MCLQALVLHHRTSGDEPAAKVVEQLINEQAPHLEDARTRLLEERQREADGVNARFRRSAGGELPKSAPTYGAKKPAGATKLSEMVPDLSMERPLKRRK